MINEQILRRAWPRCPKKLLPELATALSDAADEFDINTVPRMATFLGQLGWECNQAKALEEDPKTAEAYEGRGDLGNHTTGDGVRFRGRGLIHLTGRDNYAKAGAFFDLPLLEQPELAAGLELAARIAGRYWRSHGCNELVDDGDMHGVTRAINGLATSGPPSYHLRRMRLVDAALRAIRRE